MCKRPYNYRTKENAIKFKIVFYIKLLEEKFFMKETF